MDLSCNHRGLHQPTLELETRENGRLTRTVKWKSKIGIFVSNKAPRELINHFSQFYSLSWLEKKRNRTIRNGTRLEVKAYNYYYLYTYYPCSWYDFMVDAEPK